MGVKNCRIPPPIGTPLIKGDRGDPPAYRHPPYQGGQGGSKTKSIFNLIETTYLHSNKSLTRS
ncbi:MAG: hypothetical protein EWV53_06955 [Microcystis panniformis Mp_MB_F_20051200_S9]|uniref:Uncharacterized protein n=1 Tax=Microcystis panniformis Mp_MB_F_20051200_S9 TaxID=2486223 RepID=A0A552Q4S6_9CHRO|nr:MAG: hypothetical protein EWV86_20675 [Microcystis panniformis Mp_MB_F_20051200_S9D]TRV64236.1 MAG: hypothetical protein EWV53_06955 [Microcystis panniformis Mp_MB_F_20051200_S9]TRV66944.1 MAG: hypothetical protein EWV51_22860 [Microcystis panniformis Mp_MB_F_20051200_S6]TRV78633.1 MAG: hypothetical protein EWV52_03035 [Microcystis panniformis Mp_MB_F_20051200_S6D]